jgi:hypothetical protein
MKFLSTLLQTHRLLLEQGIEDSHLKATVLTYVCFPPCFGSNSFILRFGDVVPTGNSSARPSLRVLHACSSILCTTLYKGSGLTETSGTTTIFTRRSRLHAELHSLATGDRRPGKPARIIEEVKITTVDVAAGTITTESGDIYHGDLIIVCVPAD